MNKSKYQLKIWESSLLFALCITLCTGLWANSRQTSLASELVRLHVVAQSDSGADQAVKLQVRDRVLTELQPKLREVRGLEDAKSVISAELPEIIRCANAELLANGMSYKARASLTTERFPTRDYTDFSLPAGEYSSLRITLGDGDGRNWWCVVFPPLCTTAAGETDAFAELSDANSQLILTDKGSYTLKFHIVELFQQLRALFA